MNSAQIQNLIENGQFVDLFDDNADESFYGYLTQQSDDLVQFESYDAEGRFDGIIILEKEDISRIRWDHNEAQITEGLISERIRVPEMNLNSFTHAAKDLSKYYGYLCFTLGSYGTDKMYIGEIKEDLSDSLILHEFGTRARHERSYLMFRWDDVTRIQAGGVYEDNLNTLYKK